MLAISNVPSCDIKYILESALALNLLHYLPETVHIILFCFVLFLL